MDVVTPEILIISNTHDYSSDLIAVELNARNANSFRLNRDKFHNMELSLFPSVPTLKGRWEGIDFEICAEKLKAVFFRAPVFLRDNYQPDLSPNDQLARGQWAAFLRALTVFDDAIWVNHPVSTYRAEIKAYQLRIASKIGFDIPKSIATNVPKRYINQGQWIAKTLEPIILRFGDQEGFIYTNPIENEDMKSDDFFSAPIMIQDRLEPKIDIRVTIIGKKLFPVAIKKNNVGIEGDWRLQKDEVSYDQIELPFDLMVKIRKYMEALNLNFGGMDFILKDGKYFFLEVNPTGEWGWIRHQTGLPIDEAICDYLMRSENV